MDYLAVSNSLPGGAGHLLKLLDASHCVNERALQIIIKLWKKAKFPLMINHLGLSKHQRRSLR